MTPAPSPSPRSAGPGYTGRANTHGDARRLAGAPMISAQTPAQPGCRTAQANCPREGAQITLPGATYDACQMTETSAPIGYVRAGADRSLVTECHPVLGSELARIE